MPRARQDPWAYGYDGPEPPRHTRKRAGQFVWPRDKPGMTVFGRWKDVLSGKGPDVWVARKGSDEPHRPVWSGWRRTGHITPGAVPYDNNGYKWTDRPDGPEVFFGHHRGGKNFYDFRTRTYGRPDKPHVWTDVKRCGQHGVEIYHRGRHEGDDWWEDRFAEYENGPDPFKYNPGNLWWNWDEVPYYHDY